jgi:hypothetical protein
MSCVGCVCRVSSVLRSADQPERWALGRLEASLGQRGAPKLMPALLPLLLGSLRAAVSTAVALQQHQHQQHQPRESLLLPGAPLAAALREAAAADTRSFTIAPGEYNFSSSALRLSGASSMEINACVPPPHHDLPP